MKIGSDVFKGRIPKLSDTTLPAENASEARNCRLRSGDLESFYGPTTGPTLNKTAPISTIYPMDRTAIAGGPYWLSWTASETAPGTQKVDVVRGNVLSDVNERTYFTGAKDDTGSLYRPKFTNIPLATTTPVKSSGYPYDWRLLGVPAPGTFNGTQNPPLPLTVTQSLDLTQIPYTTVSDGSSLTNWTVSAATGTTVTVNNSVGNPQPSFDLNTISSATTPNFAYSNINMLTGPGSLKFDFRVDNSAGGTLFQNYFYLGVDETGDNGLVLDLPINTGGGSTTVTLKGAGTTWTFPYSGTTIGSDSFASGYPLTATGVFYTVHIDYFPVAGSTTIYDLKISLYSGVTLLTSFTFGRVTVTGNTYFGYVTTTVGDSYLDNILLSQIQLLDNPAYEATSWTYTYVDDFGQEGAPAPATGVYFIGPGIDTVLTNFDTAGVTDYVLTDFNLYRAVTGSSATEFQFENQLPISTTTYADTKLDSELGEVLPSDNYDLPPDDSINIINLPNGITIVSSGNTICPSVQYVPYAYPVEYRLATDFPVVAMIGLETMAIALTAESAYLVIGSDPSTMSMSKISPEYGCISKMSAIRWGNYGAAYASNQGLVMVGMQGAELMTKDYITKKEWVNFGPTTIQGAIYEDMYYGVYTNTLGTSAGFIFNPNDNTGFIDLDLYSTALYSEHLAEVLYYADSISGNVITGWDTDTNPAHLLGYQWKSKIYQNVYPTVWGCGQIRATGPTGFTGFVVLDIYRDGDFTPIFSKTPTSTLEFVTSPIIAFETQYQLAGTTPVSQVQIAEDMMELI